MASATQKPWMASARILSSFAPKAWNAVCKDEYRSLLK